MARRTNLLLLALSLGLAFLSTLFVMHTVSLKGSKTITKPIATTEVVVVSKPLLAHQVVTQADVSVKTVPTSVVPDGAIHQLSNAVGHDTTTNWYPGQVVLTPMVASLSDAASFALTVPKGYLAYTIPDDAVMGVDHLLSPGDRVNILATFDQGHGGLAVKTILKNVQVLNVDNGPVPNPYHQDTKPSSSSATTPVDTITLAVTEGQSNTLDYAYAFGQLHVALRSAR